MPILPLIVTGLAQTVATFGAPALEKLSRPYEYMESSRWLEIKDYAVWTLGIGTALLTILTYGPEVFGFGFQCATVNPSVFPRDH